MTHCQTLRRTSFCFFGPFFKLFSYFVFFFFLPWKRTFLANTNCFPNICIWLPFEVFFFSGWADVPTFWECCVLVNKVSTVPGHPQKLKSQHHNILQTIACYHRVPEILKLFKCFHTIKQTFSNKIPVRFPQGSNSAWRLKVTRTFGKHSWTITLHHQVLEKLITCTYCDPLGNFALPCDRPENVPLTSWEV